MGLSKRPGCRLGQAPDCNIVSYVNRLCESKDEAHIFVIIGVGANLPARDGSSPLQTCESAVRAVAALDGVSGVVRSRWFSSAPVPPSGQPRYVNATLRVASALAPEVLLAALQDIERKAGRERSVPDAARTLDLDIIDAGGLVQAGADLLLPHPRAHLRAFVLYPLRDVAPGWVHPQSGHLGIADLLSNTR